MKKLIYLCLAALTIGCPGAQTANPPVWKVNLKVVDDAGDPVPGAEVRVGYYVSPPPGQSTASEKIFALTDTNGMFTASHQDTGSASLGLTIEKTGYYSVGVVYDLGTSYDPGRWNLNPTWMLKKIINPIPMYAKYVNGGPPIFNKPVGYDLTTGDWVTPHGKGQATDIVFTGEMNEKAKNDFDYKLTVSFPNPGDGIQEFSVPPARFSGNGSALRSSQEAPADGYKPQVVKIMSHHPGQETKSDMNDPNRNYYFRVRTVLDEKGNVKSALYGKIYGDFMQFRFYLNPTPNSRNVEFDPKHNLMENLKSLEQVDAP